MVFYTAFSKNFHYVFVFFVRFFFIFYLAKNVSKIVSYMTKNDVRMGYSYGFYFFQLFYFYCFLFKFVFVKKYRTTNMSIYRKSRKVFVKIFHKKKFS